MMMWREEGKLSEHDLRDFMMDRMDGARAQVKNLRQMWVRPGYIGTLAYLIIFMIILNNPRSIIGLIFIKDLNKLNLLNRIIP